MMFWSLWSTLSIQICINVLYLIIGTLLFIYGVANCLRIKKVSTTKDESTRPKKAVVEHSIRLSFHNELPQSEASGSPKTTVKHRPGSVMIPDQTQSGVIHSKDLFPSKYVPKLTREAHITTVGKSPIESEKLIEDKTQTSMPSMDFTQSITTSEEYDDKLFSRTLTESNTEDYKQKKTKNSFLNLERDKASTETSILNVTMNQGSVVSQNNSKQQTKVKESESTR